MSAKRTPIGSFQGCLASESASKLGGVAIKAAVTKAGMFIFNPVIFLQCPYIIFK